MMLRRFRRGYFIVFTLHVVATIALWTGPNIEARFWPVRVDQKIENVERVGERMCWDWLSSKKRLLASTDMDAYLHDQFQDRMVVSIFLARDGEPWRASGALGLGEHRLRYCTTLPPRILPTQTVWLEMRAWYPGPLGLWRFPLILPDVVSNGEGS